MYEDVILKVLQEKSDRDHPLDHKEVLEWCELRGLDIKEHEQGLRTVSSFLSAMVGAASSWKDSPYFDNPHVKRRKMVDYLGHSQFYYWHEYDDCVECAEITSRERQN